MIEIHLKINIQILGLVAYKKHVKDANILYDWGNIYEIDQNARFKAIS